MRELLIHADEVGVDSEEEACGWCQESGWRILQHSHPVLHFCSQKKAGPGDIDHWWRRRPPVVERQTNLTRGVFSARAAHLLMWVRGGGHHIPGHCVCNGGWVTDLTKMKSVRKV